MLALGASLALPFFICFGQDQFWGHSTTHTILAGCFGVPAHEPLANQSRRYYQSRGPLVSVL